MAGSDRDNGTQLDWRDGRPATLRLSRIKLVIEDSAGGLREYIFDQDRVTLGSDPSNDVVIDDPRVSREHCRILHGPSGYQVEDLASTNGTSVNRVRVREAWLRSGAVIGLGGVEVRFQTFDERLELVPSTRDSFGPLVGRSRRMREVFAVLERISKTNATVVLEGETGTGKEVVARAIHGRSSRSREPFVVFDCGAVPRELIESELFGHERGSFTGAVQTRQGLFEMASGGTLFLDEIGELSLDLQPKLLRALEHREIRRVGSNRPIKVDVRLIAATNRNLEAEVRNGRFREDLYYRLSVVRISLPGLRDRREDIPLLARHFLRQAPFNRGPDGEPRVKGLSEEAANILMEYHWPGNVRELLNVVERATSFAEGDLIEVDDLPPHLVASLRRASHRGGQDRTEPSIPQGSLFRSFREAKEAALERFEREYLEALLARNKGSLSAAARDADLDRKHLRKLVRKHGLAGRPDEPDE
ncbi:sigma 54-interacting transcriptional regulator [Myxococcota bacterium]|nr:sigma 54-interacting transcriptional regulator [Myxococcota bacterium]